MDFEQDAIRLTLVNAFEEGNGKPSPVQFSFDQNVGAVYSLTTAASSESEGISPIMR